MKLNELWNGPIHLNEVFDTKIPVDQWETVDDTRTNGYIEIDGHQFVIIIEQLHYTFNNIAVPFLNVAFAKVIDGQPNQSLTFDSTSPSKVIGAIVNGIYDYIARSNNDILLFVARDHVERRMRIYNAIASTMVSKFNNKISNIAMPNSGEATVLYTNEVDSELITKFKNHVSTLEK